MQASTVKQAVKVGAKIAHAGIEVERFKDSVNHVVEDTVTAAKRVAKKGRYAMEDLVDETTYAIKRNPLQIVGWTLGIGFTLGTMFGLAMSQIKFTDKVCCKEEIEQ